MANISTWTTSAASNNSASPDGFPEGMAPSGVNDSAREVMAAVRRWYIDAEWINHGYTWVRQSNNSFVVSVTATDIFTAGRRLRMIDGGVTIHGDVLSSSMSGANTLVTVSSSNLSSSLSSGSVSLHNPANRNVPQDLVSDLPSVSASVSTFVYTNSGRTPALVRIGTEQATTSGTEIDFTGIPAWAKRITIMFNEVSTNGSNNLLIQLGDAGGIETTGYDTAIARIGGSGGSYAFSTAGFILSESTSAGTTYTGAITLVRFRASDDTWVGSGGIISTAAANNGGFCTGIKTLSATLDRVRLTTVGGTDTFDAGSINISYE